MTNATIKNLQNTPYHIVKTPLSEKNTNRKNYQCYHYDNNNCRCKKSLLPCCSPNLCDFFIKTGTLEVSQYIYDNIELKKRTSKQFSIKRNKKHYFKIGQTVYHKFWGKGVVKVIEHSRDTIVVVFSNGEKILHIPTITEKELLKPYDKF